MIHFICALDVSHRLFNVELYGLVHALPIVYGTFQKHVVGTSITSTISTISITNIISIANLRHRRRAAVWRQTATRWWHRALLAPTRWWRPRAGGGRAPVARGRLARGRLAPTSRGAIPFNSLDQFKTFYFVSHKVESLEPPQSRIATNATQRDEMTTLFADDKEDDQDDKEDQEDDDAQILMAAVVLHQFRVHVIRDCEQCKNCIDKPKFGGSGRRKKACILLAR